MVTSLSLIVVVSVLVGLLIAGVGAWIFACRPGSRRAAWVCFGAAALLQSWWVLLAGLAFVKFTILRQGT